MNDLSKLTSGGVQTGMSREDPIMIAWEEYKRSEAYDNTRKWALDKNHVDGSLWAAFLVGVSVGRRTVR